MIKKTTQEKLKQLIDSLQKSIEEMEKARDDFAEDVGLPTKYRKNDK